MLRHGGGLTGLILRYCTSVWLDELRETTRHFCQDNQLAHCRRSRAHTHTHTHKHMHIRLLKLLFVKVRIQWSRVLNVKLIVTHLVK